VDQHGMEDSPITRLKRELNAAQQALREPGAGAPANLECRVADLQERLLSTPARTLGDVAARLDVARTIVRSLGPRGYLLDLIETCIADLGILADATPNRAPAPE
jgi:hypothetical protein